MSNKKYLLLLIVLLIPVWIGAQDTTPDANQVGVSTAQQSLKEISVSKFEDASFWYGLFPADAGILQLRSFPGSPIDKEVIEDEEQAGITEEDVNVLGAKVSFYNRGVVDFAIKPIRPIPVEGISKTISVWVAGRNTNHVLEIMLGDHFGNKAVISLGKLNFSGWKKLTVAVPPGIKQRDYHYNNKMGITIEGFNIKCDIDETYGTYYLYLDDLRVVTDLFSEDNRDIDDMSDAW